MSGTEASIPSSGGSGAGGLAIPKIGLGALQDFSFTEVDTNNGNDVIEIWNPPIATAIDLTQEQVDRGVYIEMAYYRPKKGGQRNRQHSSKEGAYVIPSPQIFDVNPFVGLDPLTPTQTPWTRGGTHTDLADRPNHYKVNAINEQIHVYEYLANRHLWATVKWNDTAGGVGDIQMLCPPRYRVASPKPTNAYGYSGRVRPFYFMFRYISWIEESRQWITGGWTPVIKMAYKVHPFIFSLSASQALGRTVVSLAPTWDGKVFKCTYEKGYQIHDW